MSLCLVTSGGGCVLLGMCTTWYVYWVCVGSLLNRLHVLNYSCLNLLCKQVGATGVAMVQQGLPDDITPTATLPQSNPGLPVGVTLAVLFVVGISIAVIIVVLVFYTRQKRTHKRFSLPTADPQSTDDEEHYVDSAGLVISRRSGKEGLEASELQEKKPLLITDETTVVTNETALQSGDNESDMDVDEDEEPRHEDTESKHEDTQVGEEETEQTSKPEVEPGFEVKEISFD